MKQRGKQEMTFKIVTKTLLFVALTTISTLGFSADTYQIDAGHSAVLFAVDHMNVSTSRGRFNDFEGKITYDAAKPEASSFEMTIKIGSIDTYSERRDKHLRSPDFFNANQFPTASFTSSSVKKGSNGELHVTGTFKMLGVEKELTWVISKIRTGKSPRGTKLLGADGQVTIKRSEFGMSTYLKDGAIGDEVTITVNLEATAK